MLNTRFMHSPAFMYKIFKRTITKEKNDRQCYREQKDKRKEGKSEKRQEERGEEKWHNNFSLEERPHIEELLSNNTCHIREKAETHKYHPPFVSFVQYLLSYEKNLNHLSAGYIISTPFFSCVQLQLQGFILCVTLINEPSEGNVTTQKHKWDEDDHKKAWGRTIKVAFISSQSYQEFTSRVHS